MDGGVPSAVLGPPGECVGTPVPGEMAPPACPPQPLPEALPLQGGPLSILYPHRPS